MRRRRTTSANSTATACRRASGARGAPRLSPCRSCSCSPPSTSPTARPSASCRGRPAARRPTATRSTRRCSGSATAPSGCTWSTSTPPSAAAVQPRAAGPRRRRAGRRRRAVRRHPGRRVAGRGAGHRLPPGQPRAPRRWSRPSGAPGPSPSTATGSPSASTSAAPGWPPAAGPSEGGELYETLARLDAEGCARYVVTDITKDGTLRGPNLDLLREVCAATPRPVIASGGVSSLDDIRALAGLTAGRRRGRDRRQGALRGRLHAARGAAGDPGGARMSVIRLGSGAPWEGIVGYSRVVVRGEAAWVSGTTSLVDGAVAHPGDAAAQTRQVLAIIEQALERAGLHAQRRRPHADVRHRHLPLGGDRPGARRGVRRHPAGHDDGAGRRPHRPRHAGGDRGRRRPRGCRHEPGRRASSRAWTSTPGGWSRASTSSTCATPATRSRWPASTTPRAPTS